MEFAAGSPELTVVFLLTPSNQSRSNHQSVGHLPGNQRANLGHKSGFDKDLVQNNCQIRLTSPSEDDNSVSILVA